MVDNANLTQSRPEDANKDNPMTEDDLASIKELVFASQQWNSESDGLDFSIADIKVEPAENTSNEQTPKNESKTEVKAGKEQERSEDTSADVTAQDPATCPISDEDSKDSTDNTTVTVKPTPDAKEPADNTGKDGLSPHRFKHNLCHCCRGRTTAGRLRRADRTQAEGRRYRIVQ